MATHKSAIKRHRQSLTRHTRNQSVKSKLRTLVKRVRLAVEKKDGDAAQQSFRQAARELDKAVTKGVLHRNAASRRIARLATQVGRLGPATE